MRTLKKTLALVLVFAMMIGFGAIGASAFTDVKADTKYNEEISVLNAIGVIDGMSKDNFAPDGTLTREQAAKVIAFVKLGPANAKLIGSATTARFTDVPANRWSAGYIEYCANLGIISGVGDKKFNPEGKLTTAAFTKMLLVAVGFDPIENKFVGDSWILNVATTSIKAGINDDGIAVAGNIDITRGQACRLAYLAMFYSAKGSTSQYTVLNADKDVLSTWDTFIEAYLVSQKIVGSTVGTITVSTGSIADKVFALKKGSGTDSFGRPSVSYTADALKSPLLFAKTPVASYTDASYAKFEAANKKYTCAANTPVTVNGSTTQNLTWGDIKVRGYNGVTIMFYGTDNNKTIDSIVLIQSYLTQVTGITPTKGARAGSISLNVLNPWAAGDVVAINVKDDLESTVDMYDQLLAAGYAKDSFLLTYFHAADVKPANFLKFDSVKTVEGTLTSYSGIDPDGFNGTITVDGTKYTLASACSEQTAFIKTAEELRTALGSKVTLFVDQFGMVVGILRTGTLATAQIAYLINAGDSTGSWETGTIHNAKLLYADGTVANVVTDENYANASVEGKNYVGMLVTYKTVGNKVVLEAVSTAAADAALSITRGVAKFTVGTSTTYYANDKTLFFVQTGAGAAPVYTVYVGINNVPNLAGATAKVAVAATGANSIAKAVFVSNASESTSVNYIVAGHTGAQQSAEFINGQILTYYVYDAVINGELTTVKLSGEQLTTLTVATGITYTGTVGTLTNISSSLNLATGITDYANGLIKIGSTYYTCTADCAVYYVDGGTITASSLSGILADGDDTVYTTKNAAGQITSIYVMVVTPSA